jgi:Rrf2 family protein
MSRPSEARRLPLISQTTEYAFRALAELACTPDVPLRATDLSERTGVPLAYLSKVLRKLVAGRVLTARKGHGGGFVVARRPEKVAFAEVLAALGEAPSRSRCAFGWGRCNATDPCPLHPAWSRLQEAFGDWATSTTLASVATQPKRSKRARAQTKRASTKRTTRKATR